MSQTRSPAGLCHVTSSSAFLSSQMRSSQYFIAASGCNSSRKTAKTCMILINLLCSASFTVMKIITRKPIFCTTWWSALITSSSREALKLSTYSAISQSSHAWLQLNSSTQCWKRNFNHSKRRVNLHSSIFSIRQILQLSIASHLSWRCQNYSLRVARIKPSTSRASRVWLDSLITYSWTVKP